MRILTGHEINLQSWENLFKSSPFSTFFQSPECYRFYSELSFLSTFVYAIEEEGELKALVCGYLIAEKGLIKSYFSRRAIIPGGVLLAKDVSEEVLGILLLKMKNDLQSKAIYIEIRNFHDYSNYKGIFSKVGFIYNPYMNFQLNTVDYETLWQNLSVNRKRELRNSEAAGVVCVEAQCEDDVDQLYSILIDLYSKKLKLPLFPIEFFRKLFNDPLSKMFVVKKSNEIIGGIVCVTDESSVYEWFVCGISVKMVNPQTLATWTAIKFALTNGYSKFDFMGAGSPGKKYGVRDYKLRFGGEKLEYGRYVFVANRIIYNFAKFVFERIIRNK